MDAKKSEQRQERQSETLHILLFVYLSTLVIVYLIKYFFPHLHNDMQPVVTVTRFHISGILIANIVLWLAGSRKKEKSVKE